MWEFNASKAEAFSITLQYIILYLFYCNVACYATEDAKCDVFTVLETAFRLLLRFIYNFTSRHYNYFYNVTWTRLTTSSLPGWFLVLRCWSDLTPRLWLALIPLLWRCISDRLLRSAPFYCSPLWNRVLAPQIENTLSKCNFSPVVQVVATGITFVNIRCSGSNCLPSRCLGIATIPSLFIVAGALIEPLLSKCSYLS
jgi:hypothetical protein